MAIAAAFHVYDLRPATCAVNGRSHPRIAIGPKSEAHSAFQPLRASSNASSTGRILMPAARSFEVSSTQLERGVFCGDTIKLFVINPEFEGAPGLQNFLDQANDLAGCDKAGMVTL